MKKLKLITLTLMLLFSNSKIQSQNLTIITLEKYVKETLSGGGLTVYYLYPDKFNTKSKADIAKIKECIKKIMAECKTNQLEIWFLNKYADVAQYPRGGMDKYVPISEDNLMFFIANINSRTGNRCASYEVGGATFICPVELREDICN